jgi:hypothetical protein
MHSHYTFLALEIARERAAEADARRLAAAVALERRGPARPSALRRAIARVAFAVARAADDEFGRIPVASH